MVSPTQNLYILSMYVRRQEIEIEHGRQSVYPHNEQRDIFIHLYHIHVLTGIPFHVKTVYAPSYNVFKCNIQSYNFR